MQGVRYPAVSTQSNDTTGSARPVGYARRRALQVAGAALASGIATIVGPRLVGAAATGQPGSTSPRPGTRSRWTSRSSGSTTEGKTCSVCRSHRNTFRMALASSGSRRARFERWPGQPGVVLPLLADEYLAVTGRSPTTYPSVAVTDFALTDPGQYFPESGFTVHEPFLSFFHQYGGTAIFGHPTSEEHLVGGVPAQYFQRARLELHQDGVHPARLGAALAQLRGWRPGTSPRLPSTVNWRQVLAAAKIAKPNLDTVLSAHSDAIYDMELHSTGSHATSAWERLRWLAVSINHQRATAFVGDRPIFTDLVSTGLARKGLTPLGLYTINYRVYNEVMDSATVGLPLGHASYYRLENVLYTQYFTNQGHAIHYAWWHDNFGAPMSFGCINMRLSTSRFFWQWAGIGTPILIHE